MGFRPEASPEVLIRRVAFTLTGLPPTVAEVDQYLADKAPGAYERMVDRYFSSPRHGEEMARHWLDIARYSDGQLAASTDTPFPNAWRYRDWVVNALNNDLPYNTFAKAQITETPDHMAGLGFLALGWPMVLGMALAKTGFLTGRLDAATYEEVEADRGATWQALAVVALSAVSAAAGGAPPPT